jgi:hypothetical protein
VPAWQSHTELAATNRPQCGQGFGVCSVVMLRFLFCLVFWCSAELPARVLWTYRERASL